MLLLSGDAMLYLTMKYLHISFVTVSITGFCLRGFLLMQKSGLAARLREQRWFRLFPHINDTLLLLAALSLTILIGQYPFMNGWLTAKVFGLIAYIILGSLALKPGRSSRLRLAAGLAAVAVFGWIVSVALSKQPLGLFA